MSDPVSQSFIEEMFLHCLTYSGCMLWWRQYMQYFGYMEIDFSRWAEGAVSV